MTYLEMYAFGGCDGDLSKIEYLVYDDNILCCHEHKWLTLSHKTANFAIYTSILEGLHSIYKEYRQIDCLEIVVNNELICNQLAGNWKIRHTHLQKIVDRIKKGFEMLGCKTQFRVEKKPKLGTSVRGGWNPSYRGRWRPAGFV